MKKLVTVCLLIAPVVISSLLISAHFLRHGQVALMIAGLIPLVALLIRHPVSVRVIQVFLILAAISWIRTAYLLTTARAAMGLPITKLLVILCSVAGFTFASIFVFSAKPLRDFYNL